MKTPYRILPLLGDSKSLSRSPSAYGRRKVRAGAHRQLVKTMRRSKWLRP